jgi:hypothetical protein
VLLVVRRVENAIVIEALSTLFKHLIVFRGLLLIVHTKP